MILSQRRQLISQESWANLEQQYTALSRTIKVYDNAKSPYSRLQKACMDGPLTQVKMWARSKRLVNKPGPNGVRALHLAQRPKIVRYLLRRRADVTLCDNDGCGPLHYATTRDVAMLLVRAGADMKGKGLCGVRPIHMAVKRGRQAVVQYLLEKKVSLRSTDDFGCMPLHVACFTNQETFVAYFIKKRAPINAFSEELFTPLTMALMGGASESLIKRLLLAKANPNLGTEDGLRPLHLAAEEGRVPIIKLLRIFGARDDVRTEDGQTPLDSAIAHDQEDAIWELSPKFDAHDCRGWPLLERYSRFDAHACGAGPLSERHRI